MMLVFEHIGGASNKVTFMIGYRVDVKAVLEYIVHCDTSVIITPN